jgi:hypothetical protein
LQKSFKNWEKVVCVSPLGRKEDIGTALGWFSVL